MSTLNRADRRAVKFAKGYGVNGRYNLDRPSFGRTRNTIKLGKGRYKQDHQALVNDAWQIVGERINHHTTVTWCKGSAVSPLCNNKLRVIRK